MGRSLTAVAGQPSHSGTAERGSAGPRVLAGPGRWLAPVGPGMGWPSAGLRLMGLGVVVYFMVTSPAPASRVMVVGLLATVASAAWLVWVGSAFMPASPHLPTIVASTVAVLSIAGGVLVGLSPSGAVEAFPCVAVFVASVQMPLRWSVPASAGAVAAIGLGTLFGTTPPGGLVQAVLIPVGVFLAGLNRRQFRLRTLQEARNAALAERARIARELHDVLAHSLAGLTIQLEAARALLLSDGCDPARALTHVERAHRLGVEGLTEARQAVAALREDRPPLADLLRSLVGGLGERATLTVTGAARDLPPDVALTVYRCAQEALTNATRHAPGASVHVQLNYSDHELTLVVLDKHPDGQPPPPPPPSASQGGFGLVGMRERAELTGGTLHAGPSGNGWRVDVRVPA